MWELVFRKVQRLTHSRELPEQDTLGQNTYAFGYWETCKVEFDPVTKIVTKAEIIGGVGGVE